MQHKKIMNENNIFGYYHNSKRRRLSLKV